MTTTATENDKTDKADAARAETAERAFTGFLKRHPKAQYNKAFHDKYLENVPVQDAHVKDDTAVADFDAFVARFPEFDYKSKVPFVAPTDAEVAYEDYKRQTGDESYLSKAPFVAGFDAGVKRDQKSPNDTKLFPRPLPV